MLDYEHFCQQTTFSVRNNLVFETSNHALIEIAEKLSKVVILENLHVEYF